MIYRIIQIVNTEEPKANCEITAQGKASAMIFVEARSLKEAADILQKSEPQAIEAMKAYTPEQEIPEKKSEKHTKLMPFTIEDAQKYIDDFKNTVKGKRFLQQIKNGKKLDKGSMLYSDLQYLMALSSIDAFDGITAAFYAGVRKGYKKAKKENK